VNLVVDTNIVISTLITPKSNLAKIIFQDLAKSKLIAPYFMFEEILNKYEKIQAISKITDNELKELIYLLFKRIDFIDNKLISFQNQKDAYNLVHDIDPKDLLFIALSIQTGYSIWTGDLKLHKGLRSKGFNQIITTKELVKKIE